MHPALLRRAAELSFNSGGCVKFDLKAWSEQLHMAQLELGNLLYDRKVELADTQTVKNYVVDLHNLLGESTLVERKSFIRSFDNWK